MKIDIEKAKQRKQEREDQNKREFEALKKKMEEEQAARTPIHPGDRSIKFTGGSKIAEILTKKEEIQEEEKIDEPEEIEDFYEDLTDNIPEKRVLVRGDTHPVVVAAVDEDIDFDYS